MLDRLSASQRRHRGRVRDRRYQRDARHSARTTHRRCRSRIEESGLGDVEGQVRWRWNRESAHETGVFQLHRIRSAARQRQAAHRHAAGSKSSSAPGWFAASVGDDHWRRHRIVRNTEGGIVEPVRFGRVLQPLTNIVKRLARHDFRVYARHRRVRRTRCRRSANCSGIVSRQRHRQGRQRLWPDRRKPTDIRAGNRYSVDVSDQIGGHA